VKSHEGTVVNAQVDRFYRIHVTFEQVGRLGTTSRTTLVVTNPPSVGLADEVVAHAPIRIPTHEPIDRGGDGVGEGERNAKPHKPSGRSEENFHGRL
jgi:hypothetical protein